MQNYPICKYQYRDRKNPTLVMCEKKALNNEENKICHTVTFCKHDGMWHNSRDYLNHCKLVNEEVKTVSVDIVNVSGKNMVITDTLNRDEEIVSHETIISEKVESHNTNSRRRK